jgi:predicted nucleic acid-binding protein
MAELVIVGLVLKGMRVSQFDTWIERVAGKCRKKLKRKPTVVNPAKHS